MTTIDRNFVWRGRRVLVVGLGLHGGGEATTRWLCRHGAQVRVTDKKSRPELGHTLRRLRQRRIVWKLGGHRLQDFSWAEVIVQNPGVPDSLPELLWAKRHGRLILNEASIFFARCPAAVIGLTGTRGKTTTTLLTAAMFRQRRPPPVVTGNVRRVAMLDYLDRLTSRDLVVAELSSFQLELLPVAARSPQVAVMTNLKVDHLNRYRTLSAYASAKYNIFRWQQPSDIAVLNADDPWVRRAADQTPSTVWWFQLSGRRGQQGITISRGWVVSYRGLKQFRLFPVGAWALPGRHNLENLLAATAVAVAQRVPPVTIRRAVSTFSGVPYRQELIRTWRGHRFINDTTATTPDGTLAAVGVWPSAVFIVGGTDKRLRYDELAKKLWTKRVPLVWLPGTGSDKLRGALRRLGDRRKHQPVENMPEAVRQATVLAKRGQPIVLSPGAASFGLFIHEFDRGQQFNRAVQALR